MGKHVKQNRRRVTNKDRILNLLALNSEEGQVLMNVNDIAIALGIRHDTTYQNIYELLSEGRITKVRQNKGNSIWGYRANKVAVKNAPKNPQHALAVVKPVNPNTVLRGPQTQKPQKDFPAIVKFQRLAQSLQLDEEQVLALGYDLVKKHIGQLVTDDLSGKSNYIPFG